MLMAGVVWDSNPNGALRAIKELEKRLAKKLKKDDGKDNS